MFRPKTALLELMELSRSPPKKARSLSSTINLELLKKKTMAPMPLLESPWDLLDKLGLSTD